MLIWTFQISFQARWHLNHIFLTKILNNSSKFTNFKANTCKIKGNFNKTLHISLKISNNFRPNNILNICHSTITKGKCQCRWEELSSLCLNSIKVTLTIRCMVRCKQSISIILKEGRNRSSRFNSSSLSILIMHLLKRENLTTRVFSLPQFVEMKGRCLILPVLEKIKRGPEYWK